MTPQIPVPGTQRTLGGEGINGVMILVMIGGVVLVTSGIRNASIADTARALLRGEVIRGGPPTVPSGATGRLAGGGTATGKAVADRAKGYIGVPYVWAGEDPVNGWDCSGFVTYVLHHDFGISLPDNNHTVTGQFLVWSGADTVARASASPGDLACWAGHIGIVVDNGDTMVHAPGLGLKTRLGPVGPGVTYRRPRAYGSIDSEHNTAKAA